MTVLQTGGTIGCAGRDELDRLDYLDDGRLLTDDEVLPLYRLPDDVDVTTRRFAAVPSTAVDETFWRRLRREVLDVVAADPGIAGIVVTHGTATLEETAYLLHLTLPTDVPVVLVGAQRPPTALGSDAPLNLRSAVLVAASPQARGHGVLVAFDDRVLSARDVVKTSNGSLDTFRARDHGALGDIDPYGGVWFYRKQLRTHTVDSEFAAVFDDLPPWPRVEIVPVWAGADGRVVARPVADGAAGLVVASLPPGMNPPDVEVALDMAVAAGVVVVTGSRATTGRVTQRRGLDARGLVGSDTLSMPHARLLLTLCLAAGRSRDEVVDAFARY